MSAAQAIASSRFLDAMGPMIEDEQKMNEVIRFIISLKESTLLIDPDFKSKPMFTSEEYWDKFAEELGRHYGLADIRDAK